MSRLQALRACAALSAVALGAACADRGAVTEPAALPAASSPAPAAASAADGAPLGGPVPGGAIVFTKGVVYGHAKYATTEIYRMNPDATGIVRLTSNGFNDSDPSWSADRSRIVFVSDRDGNPEIYVMNADGTNPVRVTSTPDLKEQRPVLSPDGQMVAYSVIGPGPYLHRVAYRALAPGSLVTLMPDQECTFTFTHKCLDVSPGSRIPTWSPDGKEIAYFSRVMKMKRVIANGDTSHVDQGFDLVARAVAPGGPTRTLVREIHEPMSMHFSPDGARIAFADSTAGKVVSAYTGALQQTFTYKPYGSAMQLMRLSWSPDGSAVLASVRYHPHARIVRVNVLSGVGVALLDGYLYGDAPGWASWSR